jgi:hypothetical protein
MGHMTVHKREREVYIYESWLRHALSYFSLCPRKPTDYTVGSGRIRHAASARKTPGTFFCWITHTQRELSSRMCVIYREKKKKTDSSAPSVSLIVNLARSWIFFKFRSNSKWFPAQMYFQEKFGRINSGEKENGLQMYRRESL